LEAKRLTGEKEKTAQREQRRQPRSTLRRSKPFSKKENRGNTAEHEKAERGRKTKSVLNRNGVSGVPKRKEAKYRSPNTNLSSNPMQEGFSLGETQTRGQRGHQKENSNLNWEPEGPTTRPNQGGARPGQRRRNTP